MTGRYGHQRFTAAQAGIDPAMALRAALAICARATDDADALLLLEACGLVEYREPAEAKS